MKNILLAIDDCEVTTLASPIVEKTLELAAAFASKVWLVHIVPHSVQPPFNIDGKLLRRESATELHHEHEFLQQLAQCLRERDIDATALLLEGDVTRTILKEAERLDIDLIILGCHKHGLLYGALMDFTEESLLGRCPRAVMFVPVPC